MFSRDVIAFYNYKKDRGECVVSVKYPIIYHRDSLHDLHMETSYTNDMSFIIISFWRENYWH